MSGRAVLKGYLYHCLHAASAALKELVHSAVHDLEGMGFSIEHPLVQGQHVIWCKDQPCILEQLSHPERLHGVVVLAWDFTHVLHACVASFNLDRWQNCGQAQSARQKLVQVNRSCMMVSLMVHGSTGWQP